MNSKVNKVKKEYPEYKIPVEGSLGLLALGAVGLVAWRKVRRENRRTEIKPKGKKE
ncbi:MAG: hypothetical protein ISR55_10180 [Bacteroidetes bacterium]|nr:hypothetical protein [Bacteroidota bacterium]MBL6964182.1 hypothetical protein [Bacteroidota bacterium]